MGYAGLRKIIGSISSKVDKFSRAHPYGTSLGSAISVSAVAYLVTGDMTLSLLGGTISYFGTKTSLNTQEKRERWKLIKTAAESHPELYMIIEESEKSF